MKIFLECLDIHLMKEYRLGKEVAELVRFFGLGGVFHSDEIPNYGIEEKDIENL